jgi:hypothetical protein
MMDNRIYMYGIISDADHDFQAIVGLGSRMDYELRILRQKWTTKVEAINYLVRFYVVWCKLH